MQDETRYQKMFCHYLRSGIETGLEGQADPDGGYVAPWSMAGRIEQEVLEASPLRRIAAVETIVTNAQTVVDEDEPAEEELAAEVGSATARPLVRKRTISTHELYAQAKATQKLVDDAAVDVEAWVAAKAADIFARKEGDAFINGTGVGMPRGILSCATRGQVEVRRSGTSGEVTATGVMNLWRSLPDAFRKGAWFIMNRQTVQSVRLLEDPAGAYLWQPGLAAGAPDTLAGFPVQTVEDMPAAGRDTLAIAIGNFQTGYRIVGRSGVRILRDAFTERPFVKFYCSKQVGGDVVNADAIKVLALAA